MSIARFLIIVGVTAIPLWFIGRTLTGRESRKWDPQEMFMTPWERKEKALEKARAAEKKMAEEKELLTLEREKAAAAKRAADVEIARLALQAANDKAEADRRHAEVERKRLDSEAARVRADAAVRLEQQARTARVERCKTMAQRAELLFNKYLEEQSRYQSKIADYRRMPIRFKGQPYWFEEKFAKTFNALYVPPTTLTLREVEEARQHCEQVAVTSPDQNVFPYPLQQLSGWAVRFENAIHQLKSSESAILDLIQYATGELPETIGGHVTKDRMRRLIEQPSR